MYLGKHLIEIYAGFLYGSKPTEAERQPRFTVLSSSSILLCVAARKSCQNDRIRLKDERHRLHELHHHAANATNVIAFAFFVEGSALNKGFTDIRWKQ